MNPDTTIVKWGVGLFVVSLYFLVGGDGCNPVARVLFGGLGMLWGGSLVWEEYRQHFAWKRLQRENRKGRRP